MLEQDHRLNILLVEDSLVQVKLLEFVIQDLPIFHLQHVAKDGVLGLEYLRGEGKHADRQLPDVILCDINMPRLGGFEILEAVQADRELRNIPFVMLTTSELEDDIMRAYRDGAHSFISKPIDLHGLEQVLAHFAHYWQAAKYSSRQQIERLMAIPGPLSSDRTDSLQLDAKSVNVLLVEDSITQAERVRQVIDDVGEFRFLGHLTDGEQAMAYLRRQGPHAGAKRPHLILLDLNMPNLDGYQVLEQIKSDPALRTIVVVVLTVRDHPEDIVRCYNLRANTFLTKPVDTECMQAVLHRFCGYWADQAVKLPPTTGRQ